MYHTALEIDAKDLLTGTVDGSPTKNNLCFYIKERHMIMKNIANFLINSGEIIFGGYVRDMLINNNFAQVFFANGGTSETYTDEKVHPESYVGRMTFPIDIDVFTEKNIDNFETLLDQLCKNSHKLSGLFVSSTKTILHYCHHPLFLSNFNVTRYVITYKYMSSIQYGGPTIDINLDVINRSPYSTCTYPWECLCDCVSNLMYMTRTGVQLGKIGTENGAIEKSLTFANIIELTLAKKTYISWPSYDFRSPSNALEKQAYERLLQLSPNNDISIAVTKLRYREKFFERLVKMYKKGFTILNSPIICYTWSSNEELNMKFSNNEKYCCISHDEFLQDEILIKFQESKAVIKEKVFYEYIRQTPVETARYTALISGDWTLTCPLSSKLTNSFYRRDNF